MPRARDVALEEGELDDEDVETVDEDELSGLARDGDVAEDGEVSDDDDADAELDREIEELKKQLESFVPMLFRYAGGYVAPMLFGGVCDAFGFQFHRQPVPDFIKGINYESKASHISSSSSSTTSTSSSSSSSSSLPNLEGAISVKMEDLPPLVPDQDHNGLFLDKKKEDGSLPNQELHFPQENKSSGELQINLEDLPPPLVMLPSLSPSPSTSLEELPSDQQNKYNKNHPKSWTLEEDKFLLNSVKRKVPIIDVALILGRPISGVYLHLATLTGKKTPIRGSKHTKLWEMGYHALKTLSNQEGTWPEIIAKIEELFPSDVEILIARLGEKKWKKTLNDIFRKRKDITMSRRGARRLILWRLTDTKDV